MDGYGSDATSTGDVLGLGGTDLSGYDFSSVASSPVSAPAASSSSGNTAAAIAQIFSTGVTAYVDSQAIQRGYTINNPQYYQSGYPGGVPTTYAATPQGASIVAPGASSSLLLLLLIGVGAFLLLKKA